MEDFVAVLLFVCFWFCFLRCKRDSTSLVYVVLTVHRYLSVSDRDTVELCTKTEHIMLQFRTV